MRQITLLILTVLLILGCEKQEDERKTLQIKDCRKKVNLAIDGGVRGYKMMLNDKSISASRKEWAQDAIDRLEAVRKQGYKDCKDVANGRRIDTIIKGLEEKKKDTQSTSKKGNKKYPTMTAAQCKRNVDKGARKSANKYVSVSAMRNAGYKMCERNYS